jgi:hypothetical protein
MLNILKYLGALAFVLGIGAAAPMTFAQETTDCAQIADPDEKAACEAQQGGGG